MTPTQTLQELGITGVQLLQESLKTKGLNASMTLSNSLQARVSESLMGLRLEIITTEGQRYWQVLNAAKRQAGKRPPISAIFEWSKFKPISFVDDKARMSFAWAVATNIAKGGYMSWQRDRRKNFATDVFNSPTWMAAETTAIEQVASSLFSPIDTFFTTPTAAQ